MSEVQTVKIDPDGKYVLLVEATRKGTPDPDLLEQVSKNLNAWWRSSDKFTILQTGGVEVRFEKVGGEEVTGE